LKEAPHHISGWIALDKPEGISSAKATARVRKLFQAKKAGHIGTLDPLASGLLPIALGEATKTIPFLTNQTKSYEWEATFGIKTAPGDREGEILATSAIYPSGEQIEKVLKNFIGTIEQTPPKFSAIKIKGQPAYKKARRGEDFDIPSRLVKIDSLTLLCAQDRTATFVVTCQKGVYVRVLAEDIAQQLGAFAHITRLRRTHNGCFFPKDIISLDRIEEIANNPQQCSFQELGKLIAPLEKVLEGLPKISLDAFQVKNLRFGRPVIIHQQKTSCAEETICLALENGQPVALAKLQNQTLVPKKLFNL
jgi:tRNA pseudouridine55 synthase